MPKWWKFLKNLIVFTCGVLILVEALFGNSNAVVFQTTLGLVLMGIAPIDAIGSWFGGSAADSRFKTYAEEELKPGPPPEEPGG